MAFVRNLVFAYKETLTSSKLMQLVENIVSHDHKNADQGSNFRAPRQSWCDLNTGWVRDGATEDTPTVTRNGDVVVFGATVRRASGALQTVCYVPTGYRPAERGGMARRLNVQAVNANNTVGPEFTAIANLAQNSGAVVVTLLGNQTPSWGVSTVLHITGSWVTDDPLP